MSYPLVSGDVAMITHVAASLHELDEALLLLSGSVQAVLDRYQRSTDETRIPRRDVDIRTLARRWKASTSALAAQASDFAGADMAGPEHVSPRRTRSATPGSSRFMTAHQAENVALGILYSRFGEFDTGSGSSHPDSRVSRADLVATARRDDEVGRAARWILDQPDLVRFLDTGRDNVDYLDKVEERRFHSTGGDGKISPEDVVGYVEKREVNRILQRVANTIDVASQGGVADGVLSRSDYEAFARSGRATGIELLAISVALRDGAVDGEQGVASDIAETAATVAMMSGYASSGLALTSMILASTVAGAPAAAVLGSAATALGTVAMTATAIEGIAGAVAGERDHVVSAGIGVATWGVGRATSSTILGATTPSNRALSGSSDEILQGMLEGTSSSRRVAALSEIAIGAAAETIGQSMFDDDRAIQLEGVGSPTP